MQIPTAIGRQWYGVIQARKDLMTVLPYLQDLKLSGGSLVAVAGAVERLEAWTLREGEQEPRTVIQLEGRSA